MDQRLEKLSTLCLALPATERELKGDHAIFRVKGKVFVYFMDNHHGDGIVSVSCRSELGEHSDRVRREPERFYLPAYIGSRGWFALRLDRGKIDWNEVESMVRQSYRLAAPKKLAALMDAAPTDKV